MKSIRLTFHAGALAVAIAITAAPSLSASPAATDPFGALIAQADSVPRPDSSALQPATPAPPASADTTGPAPAPPAGADTTRLVPVPPSDTGAVRSAPPTPPPDSVRIAPAPAPATPAPSPVRAGKERRARPARVATAPRRPADPWAAGANWAEANVGYVRSVEPGAAPGSFGFGVGVRHFFLKAFSGGIQAGFDQLGRFDTAKEFEWPVTAEIAYHFDWKTVVRPYVALGGGFFRHQYRGTGNDLHRTLTGSYLSAGMNAPVADHQLLGAFFRYEYLNSKHDPPNPVFDGERTFFVRYTVRLAYSFVF